MSNDKSEILTVRFDDIELNRRVLTAAPIRPSEKPTLVSDDAEIALKGGFGEPDEVVGEIVITFSKLPEMIKKLQEFFEEEKDKKFL